MRDFIDPLGRDDPGGCVDLPELMPEMRAIRRMQSEERSARKYSILVLPDGVK